MRLLPLPANAGGFFMGFSSRYMCSPTTGWIVRPNFQEFVTGPEYSLPLQFNSAGLHDTDHTLEKADNVFRILLVGDSFAQAAQVQEVQTAHQQLEDILNEKLGHPERIFEVINAGVSAWGASQELVYYREQGRLYQPDLVLLLFFTGNDIENNLPGHAVTVNGFNCFAPYFPLCDGKLDPEPWYYVPGLDPAWDSCSPPHRWLSSALAYFQQNSHLLARIEPILLLLKERRMYGQEFGFPHTALYLPNESEELRYGWQVTEALLAQFNEEVKADGTGFAIAVIGPYQAISLALYNETQLQTLYQSEPFLREADVDLPNRRLLSFLHTQNIPAVDLQQPMIDHSAATGTRLYFPLDGHWTVEGNRLAAEIMAYWLIGQKLVPTAP